VRSLVLTILALVTIEPDQVPPASCMATNSSRDFNDRWTAALARTSAPNSAAWQYSIRQVIY
jgi:hypothetical protein